MSAQRMAPKSSVAVRKVGSGRPSEAMTSRLWMRSYGRSPLCRGLTAWGSTTRRRLGVCLTLTRESFRLPLVGRWPVYSGILEAKSSASPSPYSLFSADSWEQGRPLEDGVVLWLREASGGLLLGRAGTPLLTPRWARMTLVLSTSPDGSTMSSW